MGTPAIIIAIILLLLLAFSLITYPFLWFRCSYRTFKQKRYILFTFQSVISFIIICSLSWKLYEEIRYHDEIYIAEKILQFPLPEKYTVTNSEVSRDYLPLFYNVSLKLHLEGDANEEFVRKIQSITNPRGHWKLIDKNTNTYEFEFTNYHYEDFYTELYITYVKNTGELDFLLRYYNS